MLQLPYGMLSGSLAALLALGTTGCQREEGGFADPGTEGDPAVEDSGTYDVRALGLPRFVRADYIDLGSIRRISKFRSAIGHDYSDDLEDCRSMKHYFQPRTDIDWSGVPIFAPVDGTVVEAESGWAGSQVRIVPRDYPAFVVILFHVDLAASLDAGDGVGAGQVVGTHIGSQTMSDVAVGVSTPQGWQLVSYFDVMSDGVFAGYQARGLAGRGAAIISRQARDAAPLACRGETFEDEGTLVNWIFLR